MEKEAVSLPKRFEYNSVSSRLNGLDKISITIVLFYTILLRRVLNIIKYKIREEYDKFQ